MAEFYITLDEPEKSAGHQIHNANCESLPPINSMRYLGSFSSEEAAHSKARGYYDSVCYCEKCIKH